MEAGQSLVRFLTQLRKRTAERCDLCAADIPEDHEHLLDTAAGTPLCVCHACYVLFTHKGAAQGRYRAIPDRYMALPELRFGPDGWLALGVPVGLIYIVRQGDPPEPVAYYPGRAGVTRSLLAIEAWDRLVAENPVLADLEPEVEALLLWARPDGVRAFIVPVDRCFELAGRIRTRWRGLTGGEEVCQEVEAFFKALEARCSR